MYSLKTDYNYFENLEITKGTDVDNLKKYKIAEGHTADIFEVEEKKILKLFKLGYSKEIVHHEYSNHCMVSKAVQNVPKPFESVEENQRFGFIMEKAQGESLASLMQDDDTFDDAIEIFANLHKNWLMQTMDGPVPYTEWMLHLIHERLLDGDLIDKIKRLPSGSNLCHGDFHPYNIIITSEKNAVIIDFANICTAPKEYDVARTFFLLKEAVPEKPIAELYLKKMHLEYRHIRAYVDVLETLRQYEI